MVQLKGVRLSNKSFVKTMKNRDRSKPNHRGKKVVLHTSLLNWGWIKQPVAIMNYGQIFGIIKNKLKS